MLISKVVHIDVVDICHSNNISFNCKKKNNNCIPVEGLSEKWRKLKN